MQKNNKKNVDHTIHTLNNLLTSTGLCTQLLLKKLHGPLNIVQRKYLKIILSDNKKMAKLIKKIK